MARMVIGLIGLLLMVAQVGTFAQEKKSDPAQQRTQKEASRDAKPATPATELQLDAGAVRPPTDVIDAEDAEYRTDESENPAESPAKGAAEKRRRLRNMKDDANRGDEAKSERAKEVEKGKQGDLKKSDRAKEVQKGQQGDRMRDSKKKEGAKQQREKQ